jgi:hypothetical protein
MTYPKIKPCLGCSAPGENLGVYKYDSGWSYVECDSCGYFGPGEGRMVDAIRSHNARSLAASPNSPEGVGR